MAKLSADKTYVTVEKGDTLSQISQDYFGGASKYKELAALNKIKDPNKIYIGQKIKIKKTSASPTPTPTPTPGGGSSDTTRATITHFGVQSDNETLAFATWTWGQSNTEKYETEWTYHTGDNVWFIGSKSSTEDMQSTYSIPSNAVKIRFRVKPVSKTYTSNNKETSYWTANWTSYKEATVANLVPPDAPSQPTIEVEGDTVLKLSITNTSVDKGEVEFSVVKDDSKVYTTAKATIKFNQASFRCAIDPGVKYKARCRLLVSGLYSDWSPWTENVTRAPTSPGKFTTCKAVSETSVRLEWKKVVGAKTYDIEYATKKEYLGMANNSTIINGIEEIVSGQLYYEVLGLETGQEYFFRIRSVDDQNRTSLWSDRISSIIIGKKPTAPTTWSSTTTVTVGELLILYWVHNTQDGSSQTYAELEITINDEIIKTLPIKNTTDEEEKDKTSSYQFDTTDYPEGTVIRWRVRTAGITREYGDWSVLRTVDIYAPPTLELDITDIKGEILGNEFIDIESYPFCIRAVAGPPRQIPTGFHVTITANDQYETVDNLGNPKTVLEGEAVYSKYIDTSSNEIVVTMSADNVSLESGFIYTVTCAVSMNSGLMAVNSKMIYISFNGLACAPNAEISIDRDTYAAYIHPYCEQVTSICRKVEKVEDGNLDKYMVTPITIDGVFEERREWVRTTTGESVYFGTTDEGEETYYCYVETVTSLEDVNLAVYRREFDGSFTEIATGIDNLANTFVTDPHPSLDYARYRIVATSKATGSVSYYDVPGYPVGGIAAIIQWDEAWNSFDITSEDALVQPTWAGTMLKLPYNIDVSDSNSIDVARIEYVGREHPVTYYGTHVGQTSNWSMQIPKSDKDTLYALRRLARWMGDVYVREPSGSGYWASVSVSFSQKHCETTIPITLDITRVEGGV